MIDWEKIRNDFPITKNMTYFQSAAMSPLPIPVFNAVQREYRKLLNQGDIHWHKDIQKFRKLCADLAELIQTTGENIAFVPNTSSAMSLLAAHRCPHRLGPQMGFHRPYRHHVLHLSLFPEKIPACLGRVDVGDARRRRLHPHRQKRPFPPS